MPDYPESKTEVETGLRRALSRIKAPVAAASRIIERVDRRSGSAARPSASGMAHEAEQARSRRLEKAAHPDELELWPLPGLAPMTRVRTSFGDVHSIALRKGDKVLLKTGEYKPILWLKRIMLEEHILKLKTDSNPILLGSGSLAPGLPTNDMMVSPRQVFCAEPRAGIATPREASMLVSRSGIRRFSETGLTYTMLHVGEDADIFCEGVYLRFPMEA